MITGVSNVFTPSGQKPAENQNQQTQPSSEEQAPTQEASRQSNSNVSQSSNSNNAAQSQPAASSSKSASASQTAQSTSSSQAASSENTEESSSFNDNAYTRRVAERVQAEMVMNSVFNTKTQSSALPSLFASAGEDVGASNKAVLKKYMENSESA